MTLPRPTAETRNNYSKPHQTCGFVVMLEDRPDVSYAASDPGKTMPAMSRHTVRKRKKVSVAVYILVETVKMLLNVLFILLLIRSTMSWMPLDEESKFSNFVNGVTEPIVIPFRLMTEKIPSLQGLPVDLSVFFASVTILIVFFLLSLIPIS